MAAALSVPPRCAVAADDVLASGESAAVVVDTRGGFRIAKESAQLAFSPSYSLASAAGLRVVLRKVERPDTAYAVTSVVDTCEADESGVFAAAPDGDRRYVRFIHSACDALGAAAGEVLTADVSFAHSGEASSGALVDARANSLQLAMETGKAISVAYDTDWTENASSLEIAVVRLSGEGGEAVAEKKAFSANAAASGLARIRNPGFGRWRLACSLLGDGGSELLRYETADFSGRGGGFALVIR